MKAIPVRRGFTRASPLLAILLYSLYITMYENLYLPRPTAVLDIMQPQGSREPDTSPRKPQSGPGITADAPSPRRGESEICQTHRALFSNPLSSLALSSSPEFRLVAGMTVMMLLLLGTVVSVSSYGMSPRIAVVVLAVFLVFFGYSILVAVRCRRHAPTGTGNTD